MDPIYGKPRIGDRVKHFVFGEGKVIQEGTTAHGADTYKARFERHGIESWHTDRELEILHRDDMTPDPTVTMLNALAADQSLMDEARSAVALGATMNDLGKWALSQDLHARLGIQDADDIDWGEVFDHVAESVDPTVDGPGL
jgi:hypothetical protein